MTTISINTITGRTLSITISNPDGVRLVAKASGDSPVGQLEGTITEPTPVTGIKLHDQVRNAGATYVAGWHTPRGTVAVGLDDTGAGALSDAFAAALADTLARRTPEQVAADELKALIGQRGALILDVSAASDAITAARQALFGRGGRMDPTALKAAEAAETAAWDAVAAFDAAHPQVIVAIKAARNERVATYVARD